MPKVLGWSSNSFSSKNMGTLFPKKEWWIDSILSENTKPIWRGSIGGSRLEDHRAKQVKRSLKEAGVEICELVYALGEGQTIVAISEYATIESIPEKAEGLEWRHNSQFGQPLHSWLARWQLVCETTKDIEQALTMGAHTFLVNPRQRDAAEDWEPTFPAQFGTEARPPYTTETLCASVHRLLGERAHTKDRARYLGDAIWDITNDCELLILVHADKHGDCLGLYAKEEVALQERLASFAQEKQIVLVPFSIPIMNGRWNRSVRDFLRRWSSEDGSFPIPVFELKEEEESEQEENSSDESEGEVDSEE